MTWVTMNPTNVITVEQTTATNGLLTKIFQAVIDFLFTFINVLVDFFTQPTVLSALVVIGIVFGAWKMLKKKSVSY